MAYWIQEYGGDGKNDSRYKLFYCESESDVADLPNLTDEGIQQGTDNISNKPCIAGCEALALDTGDLYVLKKTTNMWEKIGG